MVKQKKAEGFTWGAVNRHHQHRLASTTPPLPPVRRQNHVLITNTYTHRKQRHVAVVEGRIKICLKCLCVFYSNVSNGASFKKQTHSLYYEWATKMCDVCLCRTQRSSLFTTLDQAWQAQAEDHMWQTAVILPVFLPTLLLLPLPPPLKKIKK